MHKPKILLIEDEEDIAALIKLQAEIAGYQIIVSYDGLNGYSAIEKEMPDLLILDIMLPGQNGLEKSEETDVVLGLELGADDYVTKPFSPRILFCRVKAVLRRRNEENEKMEPVVAFGEFAIDIDKYRVKKGDSSIQLTLSEFGILRRLVQNRGKVFTRNQLLDDLQTDDAFVVDRNIDVHIAALRKKLGPNFDYIETVRGVGYRFLEE